MNDCIIILDFGSQYAQLIARRVREINVYCELIPWDASPEKVLSQNPKGIILSGSPSSVYEPEAPQIPQYILDSQTPILGICYGMQALTHQLGGKVSASPDRKYAPAQVEVVAANSLLPVGNHQVWMSHGDQIERLPAGFTVIAKSQNSPFAAIANLDRHYYGLQFHPEVHHTQIGKEIIKNFVADICQVSPTWTPENIISENVERIHAQVGKEKVLSAVSGGVDSSVATAIVQRAVGSQLVSIFVDTGLLRAGEAAQVRTTLHDHLGIELITIDAVDQFMSALKDITAPETKRKVIGELFIRIFEEQARKLGQPKYLVQGTIYPDVVESSATDRNKARKIKTHHNVGGLPTDMKFQLVEPLRYLFKDEVRLVGEKLGLPADMVWRQPFPGPGLAVRCLGAITPERIEKLRAADLIFTDELKQAGLLKLHASNQGLRGTSQAFAVLLPVFSVGVTGDQRTYEETIALRAVTTEDFMTADWAWLPHELLAKVADRIVNEVSGINRVVYDITNKPPATIEWE